MKSQHSDTQPFLVTVEKEVCLEWMQSPLLVAMCSFRGKGAVTDFAFDQHAKTKYSSNNVGDMV